VTGQPELPGGPVRRPLGELPTAVVLLVAGFGVAAVMLGHWRKGMFLVGLAALVAALLRLVLRTRDAGLLVVRGRAFDVLALACIGGAVLVLTAVVPATTPG
jgi:hypothetical protein